MSRRFLKSRGPKARRSVRITTISLASVGLIILGFSASSEEIKVGVLLPALLAVFFCVLSIWRFRSWRQSLDVLEPPVFISLWCLAFYLFPTLVWSLGLWSIPANPIIADDLPHWMSMSCWLTLSGLAMMWLGYLFVTKRRALQFQPPIRFDPSLRINAAVGIYIASIIVRFVLYTYGLRGNAGFFRAYLAGGSIDAALDQVINVIVKCLMAAGPALFIAALSPSRFLRIKPHWLFLILLCESVLGILSGSRAGVVLNLLIFAAYYRYGKGRYPSWKLVPVALLLLVLSVPIINQIRDETTDLERMNPTSFLSTLQTASRDVVRRPAANLINEVFGVVFGRQMYVFQMQAAVLRLHPHTLPFKGPEQLIFFPLYLVPRAFWPDKPALFDALEASNLYAEETVLVFSSPILPAELYSLAGWPTVLLGMFVFGLIQGLAYRFLVGSGRALPIVLFTMIFFELSHWEGQLSGILATLLRSVPLFWIFLTLVLFRGTKRRSRVGIRKIEMEKSEPQKLPAVVGPLLRS